MHCYVKDGRTFKTKHHAPGACELVIASIYDEVSTIEIPGESTDVSAGDFVFAEDYGGVVREVEARGGMLMLSCGGMSALLDRDVFAETVITQTVEAYLEKLIINNFIEADDHMYRLPFLKVEVHTQTPGIVRPEERDGVFNIKAHAEQLRRTKDIFVDFSPDGEYLVISIMRRDRPMWNIDMSASGFEVLEECFSHNQTARITTKNSGSGETVDWYLLDSGEVTNDIKAAGRASGAWEKIAVDEKDDARQIALDRFAKNSRSHIIEFAARNKYGFCDMVNIRTRSGSIVNSYISAVKKRSGDARTIYKTGEMRLTLEEGLLQHINLI